MTVGLFTTRLVPVFVRKAANQTVTSSTTLANDNHLALALSASATYLVDLFLIVDGSTTGDFKMGWTFPTGATGDWTINAINTGAGAAATSGSITRAAIALASSENAGAAGAGTKLILQPRGLVVTSTTAGTLQLQWAQNTSDATGTVVYAGSWMRLERVL